MIYPIKYGLNVSAEIVRDNENDNAQVKIYAPCYKNKEYVLSFSYKASEFTDSKILNDRDFNSEMLRRYGI